MAPSFTSRKGNRSRLSVVTIPGFIRSLLILGVVGNGVIFGVQRYERQYATHDHPRIVISNATRVSIEPWEQRSVSFSAESSKGPVTEADLSVRVDNGKVELVVEPRREEKPISIRLRVPRESTLAVELGDDEFLISQPAGVITLTALGAAILLDLPESARIEELRPTKLAQMVFSHSAERVVVDNAPAGIAGRPVVRVIRRQRRIYVTYGEGLNAEKAATSAAQAIAAEPMKLGEELRLMYPQLKAEDRELPLERTVTREPDGDVVRLDARVVSVNASVRNKDGKAVTGLTKDAFKVYEDEVLQEISHFSSDQSPFNLILLIDLSTSVREDLELIKDAALHFLDVIGEQDRAGVITFTNDVQVVSHLTSDRNKIRQALQTIETPNGGTSFFDAVGYVLAKEFKEVRGQRNAIIVLSDGMDNSMASAAGVVTPKYGSFLYFEQLLDALPETGVAIYPIQVVDNREIDRLSQKGPVEMLVGSPSRQEIVKLTQAQKKSMIASLRSQAETAREQMQQLADSSGGSLYRAERLEDLKSVYDQVADELRTIYSFGYYSTNPASDGKWRSFKIRVDRPGAVIRTRKGYFAK